MSKLNSRYHSYDKCGGSIKSNRMGIDLVKSSLEAFELCVCVVLKQDFRGCFYLMSYS